jgi:hypothetical protein
MDNKQKTKHEKMFQEGNFPFPFKKCEKMAEMIKTYCAGEGRMADCCSMMKKMMGCGKGEEPTNPGSKP